MKPGVVPSERLGAVSFTEWVLRGERPCLRMSWVLSWAHTADCCAQSGECGQVGTTAATTEITRSEAVQGFCTWGPGSCSLHGHRCHMCKLGCERVDSGSAVQALLQLVGERLADSVEESVAAVDARCYEGMDEPLCCHLGEHTADLTDVSQADIRNTADHRIIFWCKDFFWLNSITVLFFPRGGIEQTIRGQHLDSVIATFMKIIAVNDKGEIGRPTDPTNPDDQKRNIFSPLVSLLKASQTQLP